jgi:DNA-binding FrmR family transcriptional regulator
MRGSMATQTSYLDEQSKKLLRNRLSRMEGQLRALKGMVEEERCADDIVIQAAACRGAMGQFIGRLLEKHLTDCVSTCMEGNRGEITERVSKAITAAMRLSS